MSYQKCACTNCKFAFFGPAHYELCKLCWPERESPTGLQRVRLERQATGLIVTAAKKRATT